MVHYYWMNIQSSAFFAMAVPSLVIFSDDGSDEQGILYSGGHKVSKDQYVLLFYHVSNRTDRLSAHTG